MDYYAFGGTMNSYVLGATLDKYKFTGKERDQETGLDYFGSRYYDSKIGRWMSKDLSVLRVVFEDTISLFSSDTNTRAAGEISI